MLPVPTFILRLATTLVALTLAGNSPAEVVINEIHYNSEPNNAPLEFVELQNTGAASEDVSAWFFSAGIDFTIPAGTEIPPGGFLVIAEDPATALANFGVAALGPYTGRLSGDGETIELRRADGSVADTVTYQTTFPWPIAADGEGASMELIDPALDNDLGGSWRASSPPIPTPGAPNSTRVPNAPPAPRQVDHSPGEPAGGQPVTITAKITDPDGVASVVLEVQTVAPGAYVPAFLAKSTPLLISDPNGQRTPNPAYHDPVNWDQVVMVDDGTNGDAESGDSVYTALLEGQPHRTLVRYRIVAADTLGASVRVPYPDDASLNFAYFASDGVPDYTAGTRSVLGAPHTYPASLITSVPVYHVITTPADFDQAVAYDGADRIDRNNYDARSAYNWSGTFVHDGRVFDNIGYRLRQRNARYAGTGKRSFKFRFHRGSYPTFRDMDGKRYSTEWKFLASHKMRSSRGNYTWGMEQVANHMLWNMTGTPAPHTHWFNMRVIRGAEEAPAGNNGQYLGDHYGLLLAMEEFDTRFLDAHDLEKGNLYKLISGRTDGVSVRRYLSPTGVDDGSDFQNIIFQLRPERDDSWLNTHVNYDHWNRYHVVCDAVRHYDFAPNTAEHLKNRAFYFKPVAGNPLGQLHTLPWDSDTSWGPSYNSGEDFCKQAIYGTDGNSPRPEFIKEYNNFARSFRDLIWTEEQISLLLDPLAARIADLVPADRDRWIDGVGGSADLPALEPVVADMKKFAFIGGSWVGGEGPREAISKDSGISGQEGRDAYLDALAADIAIPDTPTITYSGDAEFPQDGLAFQSSTFSDPEGAGTFGTMQWRIAEITPTSTEVIPPGAEWRYLDDGSDQGTAWRAPNFDDSTWDTGSTPAGYGGISAFPTFATTVDFGGITSDRHITTYFRSDFDIADPALLDSIDFEFLIDDGTVVFINGQEVYREGFSPDVTVGFDTPSEIDGNELNFDPFTLTDTSILVAGKNSIAVELHQRSSGSSDVGFEMSATTNLASNGGVRFEWEADWNSVELSPFAAEVTPPSTAVKVGATYRARVRHEDNTGRWSHWSEPLEFTVSDPQIQPWLNGLAVTEIMYHPASPSAAELAMNPALVKSDFEWIEITNVSAGTLDLADIRFTKGIEFDFVTAARSEILPGERMVIVADEEAFNRRYGYAATPSYVVGVFDKSLANGGERVKLSFGGGTAIRDFEYNDKHPWPETPDGDGPSLTLIAPATLPDHGLPQNWRPSAIAGGSPGSKDSTTFVGDPLADDNGDGIANIIAYAAGTHHPASIVTIDGIPFLALSYDASPAAEDVIVTVETSNDLATWSTASEDIAFVSSIQNPAGLVTMTFRSTTPFFSSEANTFLRLRVQFR